MRLVFGFRNVFHKSYEIERFDFINKNLDKFDILYNGFDAWNNKNSDIKTIRVEKRVEYFHILFIPVFPVNKIWTLRKENGVLYELESVKYKIENKIKKDYYPYYTFMLPILFLLSILSLFLFLYGERHLSNYRNTEYQKEKKERLINKLDNSETPFYLVLEKKSSYTKNIQRVDSIIDNIYFIGKLPRRLDTFKYRTLNYPFYDALKKHKLIQSQISKESLYSSIDKGNLYLGKVNYEFNNVLSTKELESPVLEIDEHMKGFEITNLGKPMTFVNYINKSSEKKEWDITTNIYLKTNQKIKAKYIFENNHNQAISSQRKKNKKKLVFTFNDGEKLIDYEIQLIQYTKNSYSNFIKSEITKVK